MSSPELTNDGKAMSVHVPMTFQTRGGRKLVVTPDGVPSWAKPRQRIDNAMVKALGRAFRWQKLLETGEYATIEEIAKAEKINTSYISRILRLTLLSPEIVEMILDGRQSTSMALKSLLKGFPICWKSQRELMLTSD
tara:strand:- start:7831 stop:8241 length:411 start_codon:yes stop_codon:yes gene_type:complete